MENHLLSYYKGIFQKYGEDQRSLGWNKGRQFIRFHQLTRFFKLDQSTMLDIGCGFGDMINFLEQESIQLNKYVGTDLMLEFIEVAKKKHSRDYTNFIHGDFLTTEIENVDFVVASGIFGHKIHESDEENYEYIRSILSKALGIASKGIAFDFLSTNVEYRTSDQDFHANPSKILEIAYSLSKNIILNNSAMPFEFNICIFKDDSFTKKQTVFKQYATDFSHFTIEDPVE